MVGALGVRLRVRDHRPGGGTGVGAASGALRREAPPRVFCDSPLQIAATVLFPAAVAALVYLLPATATARDDLGAWPPIEYPVLPTGRIGTIWSN